MPGIVQAGAGKAEQAAIGQVYATPSTSQPLFSLRFLQMVPFGQIEAAISAQRSQYGAALAIRETGEGYEIETPTHRIPVRITLDADGKIDGLLFQPAQRLTASISETLDFLTAVPGTVSYAIMRDGDVLHARGAKERLAVGSAFKLAVLAVLADAIDAGTRKWDDVMHLEDHDRSLPSGRLQDFPAGSPFTLHTLASVMIAESDNTATDMLIRLLGRGPVVDRLGAETVLTTREFFTLKADPALAKRYAEADRDGRLAIAKEIAGRGLPEPALVTGPHDEGVEWYVSNMTLCALASSVRTLDVFRINPGPVDAGRWRSVAYKGGSETGVLNLTAALTRPDGRILCASVTINSDTAIDVAEVTGLFSRLTDQLATELE